MTTEQAAVRLKATKYRDQWLRFSPAYQAYNRRPGKYVGPGCIYKITNTITGQLYVGSESCPKTRWRCHLRLLRSGTHHSPYLQRSFCLHGEAAFTFEPLEEGIAQDALIMREQHYIDTLHPVYNAAPVAGSTRGRSPSAETRRKLSERNRGKTLSAEHKARIGAGNAGKVRSEELRAQWSVLACRREPTEDTRHRVSAGVRRHWARIKAAGLTRNTNARDLP